MSFTTPQSAGRAAARARTGVERVDSRARCQARVAGAATQQTAMADGHDGAGAALGLCAVNAPPRRAHLRRDKTCRPRPRGCLLFQKKNTDERWITAAAKEARAGMAKKTDFESPSILKRLFLFFPAFYIAFFLTSIIVLAGAKQPITPESVFTTPFNWRSFSPAGSVAQLGTRAGRP